SSALGVALSELIAVDVAEHEIVREGEGRVIASEDGRAVSRLIFVAGGQRRFEIYEFSMEPHTRSEWESRSELGIREVGLGREGGVLIGPSGKEKLLGPGDAITFRQEDLNAYEALDEPVQAVCVIAYPS